MPCSACHFKTKSPGLRNILRTGTRRRGVEPFYFEVVVAKKKIISKNSGIKREMNGMLCRPQAYFLVFVLILQFLPFVGKSLLKCAPTLPSLSRAERVMSIAVVIMFLSS